MFGKFVPDCVRRGSKFKVFLGGGGMPPDPPSRHTRLRMHKHAYARYYHPAMYHPVFPPQLKILYETLAMV